MRTHPFLLTLVLVTLALLTPAAPPRKALTAADAPPVVTTAGPAPVPARGSWNLRQTPVTEVVRRVKDAVVNIHSERTVSADRRQAGEPDELFALSPSQSRVNGMGTGIVIDPRGYLLTNQHVVEDVSLIRVRLSDGTTLAARVLARSPEEDLALLKINPPRALPTMPLGTARDLMVGETVIAIGNAYGYDHTVTVGVVSATSRDVTLNKDIRYRALIQTDASINPGNSGGPLLNIHGELVGVNVAIRAGAQGIGFAIPVDTMIRVGAELLARTDRRVGPALLGLALRDEARPAGDRCARQVVVDRVDAGSAAAKAGLRPGDVLGRVGATPVATSLDLPRGLIAQLDSGEGDGPESVALLVQRDGAPKRLELALAGPRHTAARAEAAPAGGGERPRPGLAPPGPAPPAGRQRRRQPQPPAAQRRPGGGRRPARQPRQPRRLSPGRRAGRAAPVGDAEPRQRPLRPQPRRPPHLQPAPLLHPARRAGPPRLAPAPGVRPAGREVAKARVGAVDAGALGAGKCRVSPCPGDGGHPMSIELTSPAFAEGGTIPRQHTGDGADRSPPLRWPGAPEGTKSFALVCEDPDAPRGTWVHWVLFDLPAETRELEEGVPATAALANGARQGKNDFGNVGYGGPAPPRGKPHRYFFKLYALDATVGLPSGATRDQLLAAVKGHVLAEGQLMGRYAR
jgi:serine protease Do